MSNASIHDYHTRAHAAPQKADGFDAAKLSAKASKLSVSVIVLLIVAGGLHVGAMQTDAKARAASEAVNQIFIQSQRLALGAATFEQAHNDAALESVKDAATAISTLNASIAPQIAATAGQDIASIINSFTDAAFYYAAMAQQGSGSSGDEASAKARDIVNIAQNDIPARWYASARQIAQKQQSLSDMMSEGTLALYGLIACVLLFGVPSIIKPAAQHILLQNENIEHMSTSDLLTGLYNRAMLFKIAAMLMSGALRHDRGLAVLVVDIDNFKEVNDTFGRTMGDAAIRAVGSTLGNILRASDVIGRVGGTEFAAFLPSTDEYRATFVAEKLRTAIESLQFSLKDRVVLLRVSIGVAQMKKEMHKNPADMVQSAVTAVEHAKKSGRNCIVTHSNMQVVHVQMPVDGEVPAEGEAATA